MISVIIPVFNGEKYLDECLSSIVSDDVTIVIVNDGSTDRTVPIASKYTENIINTNRIGPVRARNIGLSHANTQYVIFMDSDDILTPDAIEVFVQNIHDVDIVIALRQDFASPDCTGINIDNKISGHTMLAGCALIKKDAFDKIGSFDEELLCGDAYDWILRAEKSGLKIKKIDNITCMRRIHDNNMGRTHKNQEYIDYCKIIRKHFIKK